MKAMVRGLVGVMLGVHGCCWIGAVPVEVAEDGAVAIVAVLSGKAAARLDSRRSELKLFERLRSGTSVETEVNSTLVLAFFTGDRYELGGAASAVVRGADLDRREGPIRRLSPVPALIDIAPIAREERPSARLAGTRIRTGAAIHHSMLNLYPSEGATTVRSAAFVQFDPVPGYQRYKVDVEDESGKPVFSVESTSTTVRVDQDALRPASRYYWRVQTVDAGKPALRGDAAFSTMSEDHERRRSSLKAHVDRTGDRSLLALLAELDRNLGLRREACDGLKASLAESPDNQALVDALSGFACSER